MKSCKKKNFFQSPMVIPSKKATTTNIFVYLSRLLSNQFQEVCLIEIYYIEHKSSQLALLHVPSTVQPVFQEASLVEPCRPGEKSQALFATHFSGPSCPHPEERVYPTLCCDSRSLKEQRRGGHNMPKAEKSVGPKDELKERVLLIFGERNHKSQGVGYSNRRFQTWRQKEIKGRPVGSGKRCLGEAGASIWETL